jgi:hypothetical protein
MTNHPNRSKQAPWYVLVQGSYDCTFVGPFDSRVMADKWAIAKRSDAKRLDYYPMSEADMHGNMREFGECAIQTP